MDTETFTSGDIAAAEKSSAAASPAPQPQSPEPAAPSPTATAGAIEPAADDKHGPVPFERHEAILSSTRRDYDDKLGKLSWAEKLDRQRVDRALALQELYENDAEGLYDALSKRRAPVSDRPKPDLRTEDGTLMYSDAQAEALAAWKAEQIVSERMKDINARLGPIETERALRGREAMHLASIETASTWPGFSDHIEDITAAIKAANAQGSVLSLQDAYIQCVPSKLGLSEADLRKKLEPEIRKQVLADLNNTTQRATNDLNPSRIPAADRRPNKDRSLKELVAETAQELREAGTRA